MNSDEERRMTDGYSRFSLTARAGRSRVWFDLGVRYEEGRGVEQDDREAARWFLEAARQDDPEAQFRLGLMYSEGRGVPEDAARARCWLGKSADQGHPAARAALKRLAPR